MKKMKIYIVTYQREDILNDSLSHLFNSDFSKLENTEVNIINNHTNFNLHSEFEGKVNVLHNVLRPDWSGGNVSENYNQAFINGIINLNNPDTELLVTMQNDAVVHANWVEHLENMIYDQRYNFCVGHFGDNVVCHTAESVRRIGMWDENLPQQYKEADYWIRALIFNKEKSCINDTLHGLELNNGNAKSLDSSEGRAFIEEQGFRGPKTLKRRIDDAEHEVISRGQRGGAMKDMAWNYFYHKWVGTWKSEPAMTGWFHNWSQDFVNNPPDFSKSQFKTFVKYLYFEKDIPNRSRLNYIY